MIWRLRGGANQHDEDYSKGKHATMADILDAADRVTLGFPEEADAVTAEGGEEEEGSWLGSSDSGDNGAADIGADEETGSVQGDDERRYNASGHEEDYPAAGHFGSLLKAFDVRPTSTTVPTYTCLMFSQTSLSWWLF